MSDITKCHGLNCPIKLFCYRHTAVANPEWQSYFDVVPYNHNAHTCEYMVEQNYLDKEVAHDKVRD
jgi:hypothetical protein